MAALFIATPVSASAITKDDVAGAKKVTASSETYTDSNVEITEAGGYLYYQITVAESGVYRMYTTKVDGVDTYGYLYSADDYSELATDDDSYGTGNNFKITYYLIKGKTYYLAAKYYNSSTINKKFNITIEKDPDSVAYDGVIYTKGKGVIGKDSEGNDILGDIYTVTDNCLLQPVSVTIKSKIGDIPVTTIGEEAFDSCRYITGVTIGEGVTYIEYGAFAGCYNLTSVKFPDSLKVIEAFAFNSTSISNIEIPSSVEMLEGAFNGIPKLKSITVKSDNAKYKSVDGSLLSKDGKKFYAYPTGKTASSYTIPSGVEVIENMAFGSTCIDKIIFPNTVKRVGAYSFENTTSNEIVLNEGLESIDIDAFSSSKITSIKLPGTLKTIGKKAFRRSNIMSVTIPESVTSIGSEAFRDCDSLKAAVVKSTTVSFADSSFSNTEVVIYGYASSTAETYANDNGKSFVELTSGTCTEHSYIPDKCTVIPTCKTKGKASTVCAICGAAGSDIELNKLAHEYYHNVCAICHQQRDDMNDLMLNSTVKGTFSRDGACVMIYKADKAGKYNFSLDSINQRVYWELSIISAKGIGCYHDWDRTSGKVSMTVSMGAGETAIFVLEYTDKPVDDYEYQVSLKCEHSDSRTVTTKATQSKDGSIVKTCSCCDKVLSKTVIPKASNISISSTSYTYDGKVKKPAVTVKDSKGKNIATTNYTVSYSSGCKNVGKYTVKIAFKGNYSGTVTRTFTIVPKSTRLSKLVAAKKGFKAIWKKQATQTTGYQIQIATNSKFTKGVKTYTVSKNSTISRKITKLTGKKKYYVRVRTYKKVGSTKYYSAWSAKKYVTTKK